MKKWKFLKSFQRVSKDRAVEVWREISRRDQGGWRGWIPRSVLCAQVPQEQSRSPWYQTLGAGLEEERAPLCPKCRRHLDGNLTLLRCLCCCNLEAWIDHGSACVTQPQTPFCSLGCLAGIMRPSGMLPLALMFPTLLPSLSGVWRLLTSNLEFLGIYSFSNCVTCNLKYCCRHKNSRSKKTQLLERFPISSFFPDWNENVV